MEPTEINVEKFKRNRKKSISNMYIYVFVSIISSVATMVIVFGIIIYKKNIILDKIFAERNKQISDIVNNQIASDATLLEAGKLLANNSNEALLQEQKLKKEAEENARNQQNAPKSIVDIARSANPAVVAITLYRDQQKIGSGSGFLVSSDGMIVTNRHVVDTKNVEYEITFNNGTTSGATVLAIDPVYDVAILKINIASKSYAYLELGDSDNLKVGESVLAIGNALGEFKNSVSVGIVSGLSRSVNASNKSSGATERLDKLIQTDAAINPGNSGGPLINLYGKVVGVNVAIAEKSQSVGFALPINSIKSVISSVKKTGKIVRPFVGVRYRVITNNLKIEKNLPVDSGILVLKGGVDEPAVTPGSPAERAGILDGDIITEMDGKKLTADGDFALAVRNKKVGDTLPMKILRNGTQKMVYVVLTEAK